jgi:hypothetical protein
VYARLRCYCQYAELALFSFLFKGSLSIFMFTTSTVNATVLFCCTMHQVRARGRVKDWSFVGLSIRYPTGPLVALSGLYCARMLFRLSCLFPVEDQIGWILQFGFPVVTQIGRILWLKNIFVIGRICWLKQILKAGAGSLFLRTSLKSSSQQVGINI